MPDPNQNPYVGPRSFEEEDRPNFFGRDEEGRQLTSLVVSHRVVLLYAPSGAGKTSLLKAGVIPSLKEGEELEVLPIARVGGDPPPGVDWNQVKNIYVFNTLVNLAGEKAQPDKLAGLNLQEGLRPYLERSAEEERLVPQLLVLDQFEELFTTHPDRYEERAAFFLQLQKCLGDYAQLSLLLSMREDYIAYLDFYAGQMPDRLRTRFRMDLLTYECALEAVKKPAERAERPFAPNVAEELVDNLRRLQLGRRRDERAQPGTGLGNYVEPVHLQIVCRQLWAKLPQESTAILAEDRQKFGDVDQALTDFYRTALAAVIKNTGVPEHRLRAWFDEYLITPDRTRSLVYRGETESRGLPNAAVDILYQSNVIRAIPRGNDVWYELAHDRLVEPVLADNAAWRQENLSRLQRQAALWEKEGRPGGLLLSGEDLEEAETWADTHFSELERHEKAFLKACREDRETARRLAEETEARRKAEQEALRAAEELAAERTQAAKKMQTRFRVAAILGVIAIVAAVAAGYAWLQARRQTRIAEDAQMQAQQQTRIATVRQLAAQSQAALEKYPQRSLLLGLEAVATTRRANEPRVPIAEEVLRQALATMGGRGLSGHEGSVAAVAISPGNGWLVTGSGDKTARLWNLSAKDPAAAPIVLRGHEGGIKAVAISPGNGWLVTGSGDKTARLWNLILDELVELACRTVGRNLTKEEWQQYMGNQPYQKTCPDSP